MLTANIRFVSFPLFLSLSLCVCSLSTDSIQCCPMQMKLVLFYRNVLCCCIQYTLSLLFTCELKSLHQLWVFFNTDYNTILMTIFFSCLITINKQLGKIRQWQKRERLSYCCFQFTTSSNWEELHLHLGGNESSHEK